MKQGGLFAPISREGALVFNNLFLTTACLTVFVGTLYPLALEALTGAKISVGGPFFNLTFGPLFVALMFAMPFGPLLAWKRGDLLGVAQRLMTAFGVGLVAVAAAFAIKGGRFDAGAVRRRPGVLRDGGRGGRSGGAHRPDARAAGDRAHARATGLPRSTWGTAVAHFGIAVSMLGIISAGTWGTERIVSLKPTQTVSLSGYDLSFDGIDAAERPELQRAGGEVHRARGRRAARRDGAVEAQFRRARMTSTNEAALMTRGAGQLYLSLGDTNADGSIAIRLYYKPMVMLIWLGALVMMFGGALSLSDRRLRVGAPKPAAKASAAAGGVERCAVLHLIALLVALVAPTAALAVEPDEMLKDPQLEARARHLSEELRCMVCQNQSIDDSAAPLARDLRLLVRERLTAGRQRQPGARLPGGALRRVRAAQAAL